MIVGEHVYMVDENGVPHCYELKTGKDLWKDEASGPSGGRPGARWSTPTAGSTC